MDYLSLLPFFIVAIGSLLLLLFIRNPARQVERFAPLPRRELVGAAAGGGAGGPVGTVAGVAARPAGVPYFPPEGTTAHPALALASAVILAIALAATVLLWADKAPLFHMAYFGDRVDFSNFSAFFTGLVLTCGIVTVVSCQPYAAQEGLEHGELYALILFSVAGMIVLAAGTDLLVLFLGLEIMSLAVYATVGLRRHDLLANEGAMKYVLLGAFSSALFLFGVAFCYGASGSTNLHVIGSALLTAGAGDRGLFLVGLMLLLSGLAFKVGAFPFHMWVPDVYQGATAPITGYMATAVKAASFAFFIRIVLVGFGALHVELQPALWWLAVLTMFVGNILALMQSNLKRMLAYSSIAHTGYLLVGLTAAVSHARLFDPGRVQITGGTAMLYYLAAYAITNLAAFACITYLSGRDERRADLDSWAGLGRRHPWIALAMSVCMLSLIGFPPTAGFFGKYLLFTAAMKAGQTPLAVIGIVNSILSIWYYLRVVVVMTMRPAPVEAEGGERRWGAAASAIYGALVVVWAGIGTVTLIGLFPGAQSLFSWAQLSLGSLF